MKLTDDPRFQIKRYAVEFVDRELEAKYRQRAHPTDSRQLFVVILLAAIFFLVFLALDLADGINRDNIAVIAGLRGCVTVTGLVCCLVLWRGVSVQTSDWVGIIFSFVLFSGFASRTVLFNQGVDAPPMVGVSGYMLILGVYMFSALPMRTMAATALYGSITFIAAAVAVQLATPALINLLFWVAIVNLFGGITAHRFHRLRRQDFINFMTLEEANRQLHEEISERMEAEEAARLAQEKAEIANKAKSRFLAAASHDLRQPLHAMGMFISALGERLTAEKDRELITKLESSVSTTNELFQAILDISKLDAGVVAPVVKTVCLSTMFERLETLNTGPARAKGLRLSVVPSRARVACDEIMLERILFNLISNAIRYTPPGGRVLVGARRHNGAIRVEVHDTGIGINDAKVEKIFDEFEQLGQPERDRSQGLGLGLSISRRLARLMGTDVKVSSRPGRGSCFSLTLPFSGAIAGPDVEKTGDRGAEDILNGARILVVDDDREVLEGMKDLLSLWQCTVWAATSMDQVEEMLETQEGIDAIIADYRLGGGETGLSVISKVHRKQGKTVPSLVVTGDVGAEAINRIKNEGFFPLHKPVRPNVLKTELTALLSAAGDRHDSQMQP